jgi:hypothetical protein
MQDRTFRHNAWFRANSIPIDKGAIAASPISYNKSSSVPLEDGMFSGDRGLSYNDIGRSFSANLDLLERFDCAPSPIHNDFNLLRGSANHEDYLRGVRLLPSEPAGIVFSFPVLIIIRNIPMTQVTRSPSKRSRFLHD